MNSVTTIQPSILLYMAIEEQAFLNIDTCKETSIKLSSKSSSMSQYCLVAIPIVYL
jgi:hypothetical protein